MKQLKKEEGNPMKIKNSKDFEKIINSKGRVKWKKQ